MSKSNIAKGQLLEKPFNDFGEWDDQDSDDHYESNASSKSDRSKRKTNGEAKRRYERMQDDLRLKEQIYGDLGY